MRGFVVCDGEGLGRGKALDGCTLKLVLQRMGKPDKTLAKTKAVKTKNAVDKAEWNEMFLVTELTAADYLAVEVEDARTVGHKNLGGALLCQVQTIQPQDEVIDATYSLVAKPGGGDDSLSTVGAQDAALAAATASQRGGGGDDAADKDAAPYGKVHLRLYYSNVPQSRSKVARPESLKLTYEHFYDQFRTGDLISYGTYGLVAAATRLATNAPVSRSGVVLRLPNKYTRRDELYVVEMGSNHDGEADAFSERRGEWGLNLFRLFDRLHQFHGSTIWWSRLKVPIERARYEATLQWLQQLYDAFKAWGAAGYGAKGSLLELLKGAAKRGETEKGWLEALAYDAHPATPHLYAMLGEKEKLRAHDAVDLVSGAFVNALLVRLGLIRGDEYVGYPTPKRMICLRCYASPAIIGVRERYWHAALAPDTVKASLASQDAAAPQLSDEGQAVKRMDLIRRVVYSFAHVESDLLAMMKVGGLFVKFSKGSKQAKKVALQLEADEVTLSIGGTKLAAQDIVEVRRGMKTLAMEKAREAHAWQEDLCFSIMYGIRGKSAVKLDSNSVDVGCRTRFEYYVWIAGLKMLIERKHDPERAFIMNEFRRHRKQQLNLRACIALLEKINFRAPKRQIKAKFIAKNRDGQPGLSFAEFMDLLRELRMRPEVRELYTRYAREPARGLAPDELRRFLHREQGETMVTEQNCRLLIMKFAPELKALAGEATLQERVPSGDVRLGEFEFEEFLTSALNQALAVNEQLLTQDMTQPLAHYWIASSHNTYLEGHQLTGTSSVEQYIRVLKSGCRCIELDCWDGDEGEPIIYHGHTFVSKISFEAVIQAVADYSFFTSPYPVILSIENHCSVAQQDRMAAIMEEKLGTMLARAADRQRTDHPGRLPSPEFLREKVLVKGKMLTTTDKALPALAEQRALQWRDTYRDLPIATARAQLEREAAQEDAAIARGELERDSQYEDDDLDAEGALDDAERARLAALRASQKKEKVSDKLSQLIYLRAAGFKGFDHVADMKPWEMASFAEAKMLRLAKGEAKQMVRYNLDHLSRIYPAGTRFASSNYSPHEAWAMGCQLVALNYQTLTEPMFMNYALFNTQARCGYVLRPPWLRSSDPKQTLRPVHQFDELVVRVFSARQLPKKKALEAAEKSVIDPYVQLQLLGAEKDERTEKTRVVASNGYTPSWDQTFSFKLSASSSAFLIITVLDSPNARRLGWNAVPVEAIRPGYRTLALLDDGGREIPQANVFMHFRLNAAGGGSSAQASTGSS